MLLFSDGSTFWFTPSASFPSALSPFCHPLARASHIVSGDNQRVWTRPALQFLFDHLNVKNVASHATMAKLLNDAGHRTLDNREYTKDHVKTKINSATGELKAKIEALKKSKKENGISSLIALPLLPPTLIVFSGGKEN